MRRQFLGITKLIDNFITRKTFDVYCSQKVLLRGRTRASLKICLHGRGFAPVEITRSHLAWSTDDSRLTCFGVIKIKLVLRNYDVVLTSFPAALNLMISCLQFARVLGWGLETTYILA